MTKFTDEERDEVVSGWYRAQHNMTQAQYCAAVAERTGRAVMPRTLRSWLRSGAIEPFSANLLDVLRQARASVRQMEEAIESVADAVMKCEQRVADDPRSERDEPGDESPRFAGVPKVIDPQHRAAGEAAESAAARGRAQTPAAGSHAGREDEREKKLVFDLSAHDPDSE